MSKDQAVKRFLEYCQNLGTRGMLEQYDANKAYIAANYAHLAFTQNSACNRFPDLVCLDESRVILKKENPEERDYIHANWVHLKDHDRVYILTQTPMDGTIHDFWRMCFQNEVLCIVNLDYEPKNHGASAKYWPENLGFLYTLPESKGYLVHSKKVAQDDKFTVSTIEIVPNDCAEGKNIRLIQFLQWPEKGVPLSPRVILRLLRLIAREQEGKRGSVVLHCSSGVGKSGAVVLIDWMLQAILHRNKSVEMTDLFFELRRQRAHSIQTDQQWLFIYQTVVQYMALKYPQHAASAEKIIAAIRKLNL